MKIGDDDYLGDGDYSGDGAYIHYEGNGAVELRANRHAIPTDRVYLSAQAVDALIEFIQRTTYNVQRTKQMSNTLLDGFKEFVVDAGLSDREDDLERFKSIYFGGAIATLRQITHANVQSESEFLNVVDGLTTECVDMLTEIRSRELQRKRDSGET
jgi:hypothetical protein